MIDLTRIEIEQVAKVIRCSRLSFNMGAMSVDELSCLSNDIEELKQLVLEMAMTDLKSLTPKLQHERWLEKQKENGWHYGESYDFDLKTDPNMVDFCKLNSKTSIRYHSDITAYKTAVNIILKERRNRLFNVEDIIYINDRTTDKIKREYECICADNEKAVFSPVGADKYGKRTILFNSMVVFSQNEPTVEQAIKNKL